METFKKIVGVALTLLVCSSSAFAATNPPTATETSSQGTSTLSVTIPVLYRISDIDNLTTLNYSDTVTAPAIAMNDDVCIYTNDASTSDYRIR